MGLRADIIQKKNLLDYFNLNIAQKVLTRLNKQQYRNQYIVRIKSKRHYFLIDVFINIDKKEKYIPRTKKAKEV